MKKRPDAVQEVSVEEVEDYYIRNRYGKGDLQYKMLLTRKDRDTLIALVDGKELDNPSQSIIDNYEYLTQRIGEEDLQRLYDGFKKLRIVDVSLTRNIDDPHMIFESLNSTGMDLSQSDLIRNFVLMRQSPDEQASLYQDIWHPMEGQFGNQFSVEFDRFVRDYLTLRTEPPQPIRADQVYREYKQYFKEGISSGQSAADLLGDLKRDAEFYTRFALSTEVDADLNDALSDLWQLTEVASPFVMKLYEMYSEDRIRKTDFIKALRLAESYVFRRSVCGMQTRSLGQIFSSLTYTIREESPLESIKVGFGRMTRNRRYPRDDEFREAMLTRDIYFLRVCRFLLDRLENDSKERIATSDFTIEHVMPQNSNLPIEWRTMLGNDWARVHEAFLHRLGNLTLTGYNERYSDESFETKKAMPGGFHESPLRLNRFIKEQDTWSEDQIEERGRNLAAHAVKLWQALEIDREIVQRYELEDRKSRTSHLTLDDVERLTGAVRQLFDKVQAKIFTLGDDVTEILARKNITYHIYEYFVQIIPRSDRLTVVLNLDYEEINDEAGFCSDATRQTFIMYASYKGGTFLTIRNDADIEQAMPFMLQAYVTASL